MKTLVHTHEKPHHPHRPLEILLFALVFSLAWNSVHVTETWLHLKTGAKIIAERGLSTVDPFSYGSAGGKWATNSWLFDVTIATFDKVGGIKAVVFIKSLTAAAAFALLLPINPGSPFVAASLLALGACASWTGFTETPVVCDLLFFSLLLRLLRPRLRFHWWHGACVAGVTALWANTHGASAPLALWLVGLKVFKASLRTAARERLGYWLTFGVCALSLSWNPLGWSVLGQTFVDATTAGGGWPTELFSLYTLFAVAGLASCRYTLQQEFVMTLSAATVIALSFVLPGLRPLSILAACPVISLALGHWFKPRADPGPRILLWAVFAFFLFASYRHFVTAPLSRAGGYGSPILGDAMRYLQSNSVRGRMFNEPDAGSELIGLGDRSVFVDTRPGLYPASFQDEAAAWPRLFQQLDTVYRFDYAVVLNRRAGAPAQIIDADPAWALAYADDRALIYLKRTGENAGLLASMPPRLISPNRMWPDTLDPLLKDKSKAVMVLKELDRWRAQAPGCMQTLIWKAYALWRLGLVEEADRCLELASARPILDPELRAAYAWVLETRGRTRQAKDEYDEALRSARLQRQPRVEAEILPRLAVLCRKLGDEAGAHKAEGRIKILSSE